MKKRFVIVLLFLFVMMAGIFATVNAAESDSADQSQVLENAFETNVWPWLGSFFNIGYERGIGSMFSIRPRAFYFGLLAGSGLSFYGFGADIFFHPMNKGLEGWYLGPRYDVWLASSSGTTGAMNFIGLMAGYRWVFSGGFELAIAIGAQKNIANTVSTSGSTTSLGTYTGTLPAFDSEIGWAF